MHAGSEAVVVAVGGMSVLLAALAVLPGTPIVLGPAEGKQQLAQVAALLPGRYDNDPQRYYLEGMKRGATAPARLHLLIEPIEGAPLTFNLLERDGGEQAAVARRGKLTLAGDPATRQVVMRLEADGARCEWQWNRRQTLWLAQPRGECASAAPAAGVIGKTLWLGADELWLETPGAVVMTELGRAHLHECFIATQTRGGKPQVFNGLRLHDRGGTLEISTDETPARKLTLTLRRGMWPSNSGNNLLELLTVSVKEDGQPNAVGSGWATPDSPRVGFGHDEEATTGASINARCKRIDAPQGD